ncbi:MAG: hypothetical protein V1817_00955, partial [Candidatus Micrarchaeota archaeon]
VLLLIMLASSVALSFSAPAAAWLALAVFAIAALAVALRLPESERRAGLALAVLLFALSAFFVFFASLGGELYQKIFVLPLFTAFFLAFFIVARRFLFSAPAKARVLACTKNWVVVRVERGSLASEAAPGVYAARCAERRAGDARNLKEGDFVLVRFQAKGLLGSLGAGKREAVID